jgi:hypothetical protein
MGGVARSQIKRSSSTAKRAMCLGLGGRLALWYYYPNIQLTKISWIDEYDGFSHSRSQIISNAGILLYMLYKIHMHVQHKLPLLNNSSTSSTRGCKNGSNELGVRPFLGE